MTNAQAQAIDLVKAAIYHLKNLENDGEIVGIFLDEDFYNNMLAVLEDVKDDMYRDFDEG